MILGISCYCVFELLDIVRIVEFILLKRIFFIVFVWILFVIFEGFVSFKKVEYGEERELLKI